MSAATTRSRTPDRLCAEAVDLARAAAEEAAAPGIVGEHVGLVSEGDRVVTHFFQCRELGYRGWRWAVTVARASRAKIVTVDEAALLPGPDAVLAPEWVPWSERLRPGDMGPGDLLPTDAEDLRLEPGYSGEDEPAPNVPVSHEMADLVEAEDADLTTGPSSGFTVAPLRGSIPAVGPKTPMAQSAPAACVSCGFLVPIGGSLGQAFGACANEFSPADGRLVSLAYGCGGHSEAAVMPRPPQPPAPVIDETRVDPFPLRPSSDSGSVTPTADADAEDLGHS